MKIPKHVIIISFDALSSLDFNTIYNLPNFKKYIQTASYCKNVYSIYPSLTYPAHATIVTGKYPKNHGVINNTLIQPERKIPDWFWYRKYIKSDTFYDKAIEKGLTAAALLWPVTAKSKIQYNLPEIFANRPWQNQVLVSLLNGSPIYQIKLVKKFGHILKGIHEPELDNFVHESVLYTIDKYLPNLMLIHYTDLDSQRHHHGFYSKEASDALIRHDKRLGDVIDRLKSKGVYEDSAIILLGDHASIDENKIIRINSMFKKDGLLQIDSKDNIKQWKALGKTCDGSCYVYIKEKSIKDSVYNKLVEFNNKNNNCIKSIYTSSEAAALGADPSCTFMLEASKGYYFVDEASGNYTDDIKSSAKDNPYTLATHGYLPTIENYTTMFFASGKGIRSKVVIDSMNLIDEGPTIAKLMGLSLDCPDGKVIKNFLEE
ncbi:alkaline phosphatase family protein [Clostridium sp. 19966]|uniref:alkaline phosphatase family protein n=1 Tax=Clostridium sp. 19966 TaxID=2768166 RepID=UPI0028DE4F1E|nr:ectonucleotide pyrophosphatase/phosphodiesterase [Clostridium sp. 19966]MDT8715191.1 alkaline phosphatase family protein [Clostridium sp. 19966]